MAGRFLTTAPPGKSQVHVLKACILNRNNTAPDATEMALGGRRGSVENILDIAMVCCPPKNLST